MLCVGTRFFRRSAPFHTIDAERQPKCVPTPEHRNEMIISNYYVFLNIIATTVTSLPPMLIDSPYGLSGSSST